MILADSSVVIAYLRHAPPAMEQVLLSGQVVLCGVTRAEILHGARSEKNFQELLTILSDFDDILIPGSLWTSLGRNLFQLRAKGLLWLSKMLCWQPLPLKWAWNCGHWTNILR